MKKKLLLLSAIILGFNLLLSAQNFRPGYVITKDSDTIQGLIKYTRGNKFSETCVFKSSEHATPKTWSPSEIAGYRMNEGKFYVSKKVDGTEKFLEFLIWGEANIYYYNDKNGSHYFIETDESGLVELSEPERIVKINNGKYLAPTKYEGKLISVLNDYDSINQKVRGIRLNHNSLIELAKDYHEFVCDSVDCIVFETSMKPVKLEWGVNAGGLANKFRFGEDVVTKFHPGVEIGGYLIIRNFFYSNERIFVRVNGQLQYSNKYELRNTSPNPDTKVTSRIITYNDNLYYLNSTTDQHYYGDAYLTTALDARLKLLLLKIPISINYIFSLDKIQPYFGIGPTLSFRLAQTNDFVYHDFIEDHGDKLPGFMIGYRAQAGVALKGNSMKDLFLEIHYEDVLSIGQLHDYQRLYSQTIGLGIGYSF